MSPEVVYREVKGFAIEEKDSDLHMIYVVYEECESIDGFVCGVFNITTNRHVRPYPDAPDEFVTCDWAQAEKWWFRTTERMGAA